FAGRLKRAWLPCCRTTAHAGNQLRRPGGVAERNASSNRDAAAAILAVVPVDQVVITGRKFGLVRPCLGRTSVRVAGIAWPEQASAIVARSRQDAATDRARRKDGDTISDCVSGENFAESRSGIFRQRATQDFRHAEVPPERVFAVEQRSGHPDFVSGFHV